MFSHKWLASILWPFDIVVTRRIPYPGRILIQDSNTIHPPREDCVWLKLVYHKWSLGSPYFFPITIETMLELHYIYMIQLPHDLQLSILSHVWELARLFLLMLHTLNRLSWRTFLIATTSPDSSTVAYGPCWIIMFGDIRFIIPGTQHQMNHFQWFFLRNNVLFFPVWSMNFDSHHPLKTQHLHLIVYGRYFPYWLLKIALIVKIV